MKRDLPARTEPRRVDGPGRTVSRRGPNGRGAGRGSCRPAASDDAHDPAQPHGRQIPAPVRRARRPDGRNAAKIDARLRISGSTPTAAQRRRSSSCGRCRSGPGRLRLRRARRQYLQTRLTPVRPAELAAAPVRTSARIAVLHPGAAQARVPPDRINPFGGTGSNGHSRAGEDGSTARSAARCHRRRRWTAASIGQRSGGSRPDLIGIVEDPEDQQADEHTAAKLRRRSPRSSTASLAGRVSRSSPARPASSSSPMALPRTALDDPGLCRRHRISPRSRRWTSSSAPAGGDRIGYAIDRGMVVVANRARIDRMVVTRAYDIGDLKRQGRPRRARLLLGRPLELEQGGGRPRVATIKPFGDKLVITQTEPNHRQIVRLLALLRQRTGAADRGANVPSHQATRRRARRHARGRRPPPLRKRRNYGTSSSGT